jgi:hypothetical protein
MIFFAIRKKYLPLKDCRKKLGNISIALAFFMAVSAWSVKIYAQEGLYDWSSLSDVFPGIRMAHVRVERPRPVDVFCLQIDTHLPGLYFYTTGRIEGWVENEKETLTQTTRSFIRDARDSGMNMVAAVNADGWEPFSQSMWEKEYPADLVGFAVSEGVLVSPRNNAPSLIVEKNGRVYMAKITDETSSDNIQTAISGYGFCLQDGVVLDSDENLAPRTGTGICEDSRYVFFMIIDGRRHVSQGATTSEVGAWLKYFGAYTGINMDGGGSSTMALWNPKFSAGEQIGLSCLSYRNKRISLVNNPVGSGAEWWQKPFILEKLFYRPTERHNGNNIGVVVPTETKTCP